jgi:hypothetical protein
MWMLERGDALVAGTETHQLAACPDTFGRGDRWKWSIAAVSGNVDEWFPVGADHSSYKSEVIEIDLAAKTSIAIGYDPRFVSIQIRIAEKSEQLEVKRDGGSEVAVIPLFGEALVVAPNGAWKRWLTSGDTFVIEGEDDETLFVTPSPELTRVVVIQIHPTIPQALRWVP